MRIAYISHIAFSDVDISYISELKKYADVCYFLKIGNSTKGAAINLGVEYLPSGIYHATDFSELAKFEGLIDLQKTFVYSCMRDSLINRLKTTWQLMKYLISEKFDIIHITGELYYFEFVLYLFRNKMILSVHDPFPHSSRENMVKVNVYRKLSFFFCKYLLLYNRSQKEDFIKAHGLNAHNVYESALSAYTYLRQYDVTPIIDRPYVLFFGQIQSHKGLEYLLPAMRKLHVLYPNYRLIVAGKGDFYFDISDYVNCEYIEFLNRFIPDEELARLIANCEFVVCPYKDATQSGVIMSAYAFSKPVIATNVGGLPEMVVDRLYGKIVSPCDATALEQAMSSFIDKPDVLEHYAQNIANDYLYGAKSWKSVVDGMIKIYNGLKRH